MGEDLQDARQHDISVNGVRLHYDEYGDPAHEPILMLHCLGEHGGDWRGVAEPLAAGHRVVAPDMRGHGRSEWPGAYSYELMRDDVLALADALALRRVTLVGHSMGGIIAFLVAYRDPPWLARLVIEDAAPPRERNTYTLRPRPEEELPFDWAMIEALSAQVNAPDPAWWEGLASVRVPTLILSGAQSHISPTRVKDAAALIPGCEILEFATGHHIHRTLPSEFLAAISG